MQARLTTISGLLAILLSAAVTPVAWAQDDCEGETFHSTFEAIEKLIFERRDCSNLVCHSTVGQGSSGGLDLSAGKAYDELLDIASETVAGRTRVMAGNKDLSLLWLNLAAKTYPDEYQAPLRAMPLDPVPALTPDELELVRLWIEKGAPREGVLAGTEDLVDACLPPPAPIEVKPLPPPPPGVGIQIQMPPYMLEPGETEVCYASYFDITDQVPEQYRGPNGTFRYKLNSIRQTPMSHHLIVNLYEGQADPHDPSWGQFNCVGGPTPGAPCDPVVRDVCGAGAFCATAPVKSIACAGFGPGDSGTGLASRGFTGTQETATELDYPPGVYAEVPMKGMILWNSHSFNLADRPGRIEAWMNFEFAEPEEQLIPVNGIFDAKDIFAMDVPPFEAREVCSIHRLPRHAQLFELTSHAHQRMKRWRTFEGAFRCANTGAACSPMGGDEGMPEPCGGAPCESTIRPHVGDCDTSGNVTVDEVITQVNIALGAGPLSACFEADGNADDAVTVDEVLTSISAALSGVPPAQARDPHDSLLYVSLIYNDPLVLRFDPPMSFPSRFQDERSLTYCGLYDNGMTDPAEVKRRSTSPLPPVGIPGIGFGGPCLDPSHCAEGKVGEPCTGRGETARHRSCDTTPGAADGLCDACPLRGGVTTEDEMFILMGQFFVD
ncbi:MAG TPA: hypothetical protein VEB21_17470 [Terriglobales bacterium]|nr:hypothetical protein [Terriglobales bacterium]